MFSVLSLSNFTHDSHLSHCFKYDPTEFSSLPANYRETFIKNREILEHLVADLRESYGRGQSSLKQLVSAGNEDLNQDDGAPSAEIG